MSNPIAGLFTWKLHGDGKTLKPGEVVEPDERLTWPRTAEIGAQHVIAMFGATFLVPILTGFDPSTTLFFTAMSTALFLLINKNMLPSYLGSSFGFIAPIAAVASAHKGLAVASFGIMVTGILLALIGVIAVIYGAVQLYGKLTDNSKLLRQIERQIQPVMMFDPVPFDNFQDVDNKVLVKTSIWSCMYSDKRGSYTYDDNGMILIPVSDVEVAAVKLYGPEVKLTHTSLDEDGISYTYDAENNVYRVPMMAQGGYYTPMVVDMQKNGDVYEVTVGYVAPGASWTTTEDGDSYTPTPDKYMIYRMKKEDGEYYIATFLP